MLIVSVVILKFREQSPDRVFTSVLHILLPCFQGTFVKRETNIVCHFILLAIIDNRSSTRSLLTLLVCLINKTCSCRFHLIKWLWKNLEEIVIFWVLSWDPVRAMSRNENEANEKNMLLHLVWIQCKVFDGYCRRYHSIYWFLSNWEPSL